MNIVRTDLKPFPHCRRWVHNDVVLYYSKTAVACNDKLIFTLNHDEKVSGVSIVNLWAEEMIDTATGKCWYVLVIECESYMLVTDYVLGVK